MLIHRRVITVNAPPCIAVQKKWKLFCSNRLVRNWNGLTQDAVSSSSTSVFKRKLQDVNFNVFINPCSPLHVYMLLFTTNKKIK